MERIEFVKGKNMWAARIIVLVLVITKMTRSFFGLSLLDATDQNGFNGGGGSKSPEAQSPQKMQRVIATCRYCLTTGKHRRQVFFRPRVPNVMIQLTPIRIVENHYPQ